MKVTRGREGFGLEWPAILFRAGLVRGGRPHFLGPARSRSEEDEEEEEGVGSPLSPLPAHPSSRCRRAVSGLFADQCLTFFQPRAIWGRFLERCPPPRKREEDPHLGRSVGFPGATWGPLGGASGAVLVPSWTVWGLSWAGLGALGPLGSVENGEHENDRKTFAGMYRGLLPKAFLGGALGAVLGSFETILGRFGASCAFWKAS